MKTKEQIEADFDESMQLLRAAAILAENQIVTASTCVSLLYAARVVLAMANNPGFKEKSVQTILERQAAADPGVVDPAPAIAPVIDLFGHKSGGKA